MFRRVITENWAGLAAITSFALIGIVFFGAVWKAWRLSGQERQRLSSLPLDDESNTKLS